MKRALTAAVFSGLVLIIAPQVASADHGASNADCAGQTEEARPQPDHGRGGPYGDHEQHDDDGATLF